MSRRDLQKISGDGGHSVTRRCETDPDRPTAWLREIREYDVAHRRARDRRASVCLSCVDESSSLCLAFTRGCDAVAMTTTLTLMALCILGVVALAALAWNIGRAMDREEADLRAEAMHVMGVDNGGDPWPIRPPGGC